MHLATATPRSSHWCRKVLSLVLAFLLGAFDGFLYRPLEPASDLRVPVSPVFSLWGLWELPVFLLFGLMLGKTVFMLARQKSDHYRRRVTGASLVLLLCLGLLICGIAPFEQLAQWHLYSYESLSLGMLYASLNPFIVALASAFIFEISEVYGWAALIGGVTWAGTLTLFLILVKLYARVAVRIPASCFHWSCSPRDPTPLIFATMPIWVPVGFFAAVVGGIFGGLLCQRLFEDIKNIH